MIRAMQLKNPYLRPNRLQDIVAALQIMGSYRTYKMSVEAWKEKIENNPLSAPTWTEVFKEHPEFFRQNDLGLFSLMWRNGMPHSEDSRVPLAGDQIMALMNTALQFHAKAHEEQRDKRWWMPILAAVFAAVLGFVGAVFGSYLKSDREKPGQKVPGPVAEHLVLQAPKSASNVNGLSGGI